MESWRVPPDPPMNSTTSRHASGDNGPNPRPAKTRICSRISSSVATNFEDVYPREHGLERFVPPRDSVGAENHPAVEHELAGQAFQLRARVGHHPLPLPPEGGAEEAEHLEV